ncbi:AMP-binding protein [uncultured Microbacterium sp.]|uniref:AMP-binding protein n=1 Tax=uncultured Microbacterium sp. TaxID=191216 RepID=UPI0035CC1211
MRKAVMVRQSISSIITDLGANDPDRVVVIDEDGSFTAAELDDAATRLAHALRARGVVHDDLVIVSLPNGRDFVIACAAIWKAGATPEPVALTLTDDERAEVERISRPAAAIGVRPRTAGIEWFETVQAPPNPHTLPDLAAASWKAPTSSGSTGNPKVVRSTAPALLDPTRPVADFLPLRATQLVSGPMAHSATFTYAFRGLLTGHRLVILPRFDERAWLDGVQQHRVTWALVVPTMMHRLLRVPSAERGPDRVASVESLLHMGAPCAPDLKRAFLEWVGAERVVEVYAGSESNGLTMIRGDEWLVHPGSVGRPIGSTEVQIRSGSGQAQPVGSVGLVWMRRGERSSYEYVGADSRRDVAGWDTLGDLGRIDEDGYLYLVDREDDVINRGGEKIYPTEVERVLEAHPAVRSAVAFGVADEALGQKIGAVVDIGDATVDRDAVMAWAKARLGPRAPASIELVTEPVRNDAGKTSRRRWSLRSVAGRPVTDT